MKIRIKNNTGIIREKKLCQFGKCQSDCPHSRGGKLLSIYDCENALRLFNPETDDEYEFV